MSDDRPRYEHWFRCRTCGTRFHVKRLTADPAKVKTPNCPKKKCGGRVRESHVPDIGMDVAAGKAPAQVGSIPTRALDMAMEIAAQDSGLTDLNDRARVGENMAPKIRPDLQRLADNFFPDPAKRVQKTRKGNVQLPWTQPASGPAKPATPGAWQVGAGESIIPAIHQGKPAGTSPVPSYQPVAAWPPVGS